MSNRLVSAALSFVALFVRGRTFAQGPVTPRYQPPYGQLSQNLGDAEAYLQRQGPGHYRGTVFMTELLASQTSLDVIDMHLYVTADGEMTTKIEAVESLCRLYHKESAMSECWLYKSAKKYPGENGHQSQAEESLNAFSFWEPLDERFVETMVATSRFYGLEYCSFFPGLEYLLANLPYGPSTVTLSPTQILAAEAHAAGAAMRADTFTDLGVGLAGFLR